eukprot:10647262-Ditylum_brightwellii.AAC.1
MNLPLKGDYWSSQPCIPQHSVMTKLGMSRDCFSLCGNILTFMIKTTFMWMRKDDKENISKEEDIIDELYLEHVVHDEGEDDCESDKEDEEDCDTGESDEGLPGETKQEDHLKPTT